MRILSVRPGTMACMATPRPVAAVEDHTCPRCGASLLGEPIPDALQPLYGTITHFHREVVVKQTDNAVFFYACPDCHGTWPPSFEKATGASDARRHDAVLAAIAAHDADVALFADHAHVAHVLQQARETIVFALGLAGYRWVSWTVTPQTGTRLWLVVDPILATDRHGAPTPEATRMIANATGWPEHALTIVTSDAPMVKMMSPAERDVLREPPSSFDVGAPRGPRGRHADRCSAVCALGHLP